MFLSFPQIEFCVEVCKLDPQFDCNMLLGICKGLTYLQESLPPALLTVSMIMDLGECVAPEANRGGFRTIDSIADGQQVGMNVSSILGAVERLCAFAPDMPPTEWFERFLEIHPLLQGNFHVGVLLWNFLRDNLDTPDLPPIPLRDI